MNDLFYLVRNSYLALCHCYPSSSFITILASPYVMVVNVHVHDKNLQQNTASWLSTCHCHRVGLPWLRKRGYVTMDDEEHSSPLLSLILFYLKSNVASECPTMSFSTGETHTISSPAKDYPWLFPFIGEKERRLDVRQRDAGLTCDSSPSARLLSIVQFHPSG